MEQAICWCHWQGTLEVDPRADVPSVQLVGYKTSWGEIRGLYNEMYQLRRLSAPPLCRPEQVQELAWDILSSMEEHLQQRWGAAVPEGDQEQGPTRAPVPCYWEEILQKDCKMKILMTMNSLRPGRPTSRCWWLPTGSKKGSKGWVNWSQEWCRATAGTPIARATQEGDCGDDVGGTLRLQLVGITRETWGESKPSLLVPAPPGHGSMSPSRTWSHHLAKALRWGSVQGSLPTEGQGVWFGAPTNPTAQVRAIPGGASCCERGGKGV